MKKLFASVFIVFFSSFFIAANVHVPIPGESTVKKDNIYIEYLSIADAYFELGKYDKAADYYLLAMKNKKLYWTAFSKLGRTYALLKNWSESEKIFVKLLKRDPENLSLKMSLAYIRAMNGNLESSKEIYRLLWQENPENADVLVNYINVVFALEDYDLVKSLISELKEKFNDNKNISAFEKKIEEIENKNEEDSKNIELENADSKENSIKTDENSKGQ